MPPRSGRPRCGNSTGDGRSTATGSSATRMVGYVCYVDRFCGTLREAARQARLPRRARHHLPAPDAAAAARGRARTTAATRCMDYRAVDPRLGTMDDLEDVAGALHDRGMSLCIDLVLNHTARGAPLGAGLAGRRPGVRGLLHRLPGPGDARRLRRDHPRGLPGPRAGLVHLGARGLRRTAGCGRRSGPTSGTSTTRTPRSSLAMLDEIPWLANRGRRRLPDGRRPVHVEAAGHHLPEPARGAPARCSCCTR